MLRFLVYAAPFSRDFASSWYKYRDRTLDLLAEHSDARIIVDDDAIFNYGVGPAQALARVNQTRAGAGEVILAQWTAFDRWINHRWNNVTGQGSGMYELDRYLRETAQLEKESTGKETEAKLAQLAELRRLDDELGKFNNLRPRDGSDTLHVMNELGHADVRTTIPRESPRL